MSVYLASAALSLLQSDHKSGGKEQQREKIVKKKKDYHSSNQVLKEISIIACDIAFNRALVRNSSYIIF